LKAKKTWPNKAIFNSFKIEMNYPDGSWHFIDKSSVSSFSDILVRKQKQHSVGAISTLLLNVSTR
jgi:hypothetical protein